MLETIKELQYMKNIPSKLDYKGNIDLLRRKKISVVGSRKPNQYAQEMISHLVQRLSKAGICIVSGGAIGIDAVAHRNAKSDNTICVLPCGIDERYPAINKRMLDEIAEQGLLLSQFESAFKATKWSFVARNELVVALGEIVIVAYAEPDSGSMRSVEYALEMGKKIYVLPHRIGESKGTNQLLQMGKAEAIWDIDDFLKPFENQKENKKEDPFLTFCSQRPTIEEAIATFGERVYEAELGGEIVISNGRVFPV